MKALVHHEMGENQGEERATKESKDAVVKIPKTTICHTDLHIIKDGLPEVVDGSTISHEEVEEAEKTGNAVSNLKVGGQAIIPCKKCENCKKNMY